MGNVPSNFVLFYSKSAVQFTMMNQPSINGINVVLIIKCSESSLLYVNGVSVGPSICREPGYSPAIIAVAFQLFNQFKPKFTNYNKS
jgi:hypothetical protein